MRSRVHRFRRRRSAPYWEVFRVCGFCRERVLVATFNARREAMEYARARPKHGTAAAKARVTYMVERGW